MTPDQQKLFYFGCMRESGHYLWLAENRSIREESLARELEINTNLFGRLDATFPPGSKQMEGLYNDCIVPPFRIVAWWDRSVDKRFGSNSALIGIGYESAEAMLDAATVNFPTVMKRQTRPIRYER